MSEAREGRMEARDFFFRQQQTAYPPRRRRRRCRHYLEKILNAFKESLLWRARGKGIHVLTRIASRGGGSEAVTCDGGDSSIGRVAWPSFAVDLFAKFVFNCCL